MSETDRDRVLKNRVILRPDFHNNLLPTSIVDEIGSENIALDAHNIGSDILHLRIMVVLHYHVPPLSNNLSVLRLDFQSG